MADAASDKNFKHLRETLKKRRDELFELQKKLEDYWNELHTVFTVQSNSRGSPWRKAARRRRRAQACRQTIRDYLMTGSKQPSMSN